MHIQRISKLGTSITFEEYPDGSIWATIERNGNFMRINLPKAEILSLAEDLSSQLNQPPSRKAVTPPPSWNLVEFPAGADILEEVVAESIAKAAKHNFLIQPHNGYMTYSSILNDGEQIEALKKDTKHWDSIIELRKKDLRLAMMHLLTSVALRDEVQKEENKAQNLKLAEARIKLMTDLGLPAHSFDTLSEISKTLMDRVIKAEGLDK